MTHTNKGWAVESFDAECTSGDSESWDAIVTYRHADGRWVQEVYTFFLCGEVLVNGERFGFEPFLGSVDDNYTGALTATLEEHGDTQAVERNYFFMSHSETRYAGRGDFDLADYPDPVESDPGIEPTDLDTYDGSPNSLELDRSVQVHLEDWAHSWGNRTLQFNDLDDMHKTLTD